MGIRIGPNPATQGIRPERDDQPDEVEPGRRAGDAGAVEETNGVERPAAAEPATQGAAPAGEAAVVAISDRARELATEASAGATVGVDTEQAPPPPEPVEDAPAPPPPDEENPPGLDPNA